MLKKSPKEAFFSIIRKKPRKDKLSVELYEEDLATLDEQLGALAGKIKAGGYFVEKASMTPDTVISSGNKRIEALWLGGTIKPAANNSDTSVESIKFSFVLKETGPDLFLTIETADKTFSHTSRRRKENYGFMEELGKIAFEKSQNDKQSAENDKQKSAEEKRAARQAAAGTKAAVIRNSIKL